jgi:hypothetical protein
MSRDAARMSAHATNSTFVDLQEFCGLVGNVLDGSLSIEDELAMHTQLQFRHTLRPLNVFSFCGQTISGARDEYIRASRDLPPCPECQQARNRVVRVLAAKPHRLSVAGAAGSSGSV